MPAPIGDPTGLGRAVGELLGRAATAGKNLWNTLNGNRTNPPAGPAQDPNSTRGRYDPNGLSLQQVIVDGAQYSIIGEPYGAYYMVNPRTIYYSLSPEYPVNPGHRIVFSAGFPIVQVDKDTVGTGYKNVIILLDEVNPSGVVTGIHTATINRLTLDTQVFIQTRPEVGTGIPVDPDFGLGVPLADPAFLPAPIPAPRPLTPGALPKPLSPSTDPANPAPVPLVVPVIPGASPVLEPVPGTPGGTTTLTRTVGKLPSPASSGLPVPSPVQLPKLPAFQPALSPAGFPQASPEPAPLTTPTDARTYGPTTVTSGGASPDLSSIAAEVGRSEQKLAALLPLLSGAPSWIDALRDGLIEALIERIKNEISGGGGGPEPGDLPGTVYAFTPPYDSGTATATGGTSLSIEPAPMAEGIAARLDAIAEALQLIAAWRVKLAKGTAPRANLTVTAYGNRDE